MYTVADINVIILCLHVIQALSLAYSAARWQSPLKTWYGYLWISAIVIVVLRFLEFAIELSNQLPC